MPSIYSRNGVWYLNYRVNGRRVRKPVGKSKKIAELALADIQLKLDRASSGLADYRIPLSQFFSESQVRIDRMKKNSGTRYREILSNFLAYYSSAGRPPRFIDAVTPQFISDFAASEHARGLDPTTVNYTLRVLNTFFLQFVRDGRLKLSPVRLVQRFSVPDKTPRYLSADEIERLFLHMTQRFKPFFTALLYTGMRKDELTNLHWSDISNGQILVRPKSDWSPKSRSSIRSIPIHAQVKLALDDRRALSESNIFIFSTKSGHKLGKNLLRNQLLRYARDAGIQDVTVHTFRHTFASHLVQSGVSLYFVKDLLGHSSIKQTEIYAHLAPAPNSAILDNNLTFRI